MYSLMDTHIVRETGTCTFSEETLQVQVRISVTACFFCITFCVNNVIVKVIHYWTEQKNIFILDKGVIMIILQHLDALYLWVKLFKKIVLPRIWICITFSK